MTLPDTKAWKDLKAHAGAALNIVELNKSEKRLRLSIDRVGFDFSLQRASSQTLELLLALATQQDVAGNFKRMFAGEKVNVSENRAAWHTALRDPKGPDEVVAALAQVKDVSEKIRADKNITDIIHIGIGGSDLGPRLVVDALGVTATTPRIHFIANVDIDDLAGINDMLDPAHTLIIVASKTFTTQETIANYKRARTWLNDDSRIIAITCARSVALEAGVLPDHILPMPEWVNGRFSVWSAIGLPIAIAYGFDVFVELLRGARAADEHVLNSAPDQNVPFLMALYGLWNRNFLGSTAHAIFSYSHRLTHLVPYLQQLEMESNGKHITRDGALCDYDTAPVVFGGVGTNAQHAYMQALHQGAEVIPCDFIGVVEPAQPILTAHMRAQAKALAEGGGTGAATCPGNRPSTTILLPRLDAYNLGVLLAAYEHKTAAQSFLWNINAFDQFGVELGKKLAKELLA